MTAGEREIRRVRVLRSLPARYFYRVTLIAINRKTRIVMIRVCSRIIGFEMAAAAIQRQIHILTIGMASLTVKLGVQSG